MSNKDEDILEVHSVSYGQYFATLADIAACEADRAEAERLITLAFAAFDGILELRRGTYWAPTADIRLFSSTRGCLAILESVQDHFVS